MITINKLTMISHRTMRSGKPTWFFIGNRYLGRRSAWSLSYTPQTRRFRVSPLKAGAWDREECPFKLTNITAKGNSIAEILRSQLSDEDIAFCTRLSIMEKQT